MRKFWATSITAQITPPLAGGDFSCRMAAIQNSRMRAKKGYWWFSTWIAPSVDHTIHDCIKQFSELSEESQLLYLDCLMANIRKNHEQITKTSTETEEKGIKGIRTMNKVPHSFCPKPNTGKHQPRCANQEIVL